MLREDGGFSSLGIMINTANVEKEAKCGKPDRQREMSNKNERRPWWVPVVIGD